MSIFRVSILFAITLFNFERYDTGAEKIKWTRLKVAKYKAACTPIFVDYKATVSVHSS